MSDSRHYLVICLFLAACLTLAGRSSYLALVDKDFLQDQGDARSIREESIPAHRGVIQDRFGQILATSTPVASVVADPARHLPSADEIKRLAPLLGLDPQALSRRLAEHSQRRFVYLKRRVSWADANAIAALGIEGLFLDEEYRRYYPASETAAHIVGMTSIDHVGLEGAELAFDDHLRGKRGRKLTLRDRLGSPIADSMILESAESGLDLTLSIDLRLQYFAYRELKSAVIGQAAESGSAVIVDVRSGEVLALANAPSYNPNAALARNFGAMRNRAVTDAYEPGSTMKPFAALAALSSGQYQTDSVIDTHPGYWAVRRKLIEDKRNYGALTLTEVIHRSSQVGISKVALALPEDAVLSVLKQVGMTDFVGLGLPGETAGTAFSGRLSDPVARATLSYGYGIAMSPLQLAQAYATLANAGRQIPLTILKRRRLPAGRQVLDADACRQVVAMLEGVVSNVGTAPAARTVGYRVAGKTGTTRVASTGGYTDRRHIALFAGLAPVPEPRIVMVVVINQPSAAKAAGGLNAAPVFGRVAGRALRLLGVRPESGSAVDTRLGSA